MSMTIHMHITRVSRTINNEGFRYIMYEAGIGAWPAGANWKRSVTFLENLGPEIDMDRIYRLG